MPEVILVKPRVFPDERGFFLETYKSSDFEANGIPDRFVQDNYSHSVKGTLRGLHYQKSPQAQGKLVMAVQGEIFDVAVDIRQGSPTYGRWVGETLSSADRRMLWVPPGFAHGFCVLSDEADVLYLSFEKPQCADDSMMEDDGNIYHYRKNHLVGITLSNARQRFLHRPETT